MKASHSDFILPGKLLLQDRFLPLTTAPLLGRLCYYISIYTILKAGDQHTNRLQIGLCCSVITGDELLPSVGA